MAKWRTSTARVYRVRGLRKSGKKSYSNKQEALKAARHWKRR